MKPSQCRAARALVAMSQDRLAEASGVAKRTIASFEKEDRQPYERTISALREALESVGVEFIAENGGGAGVRLKKERKNDD
jgi:DNA-binding XRE family transcriptional regulator